MDELSSGLEGRSNNSIALLVDALLRPEADVGGVELSSVVWKHHPERAVSHIVIGHGKPGGAWQYMEPSLKSLSLENWLDLPVYSFRDWQKDQQAGDQNISPGMEMADVNGVRSKRPFVGEMARYYSDYVVKMGLDKNFVSNAEVAKVSNMDKNITQTSSQSTSTSWCSFSSSPPSLTSPNSPVNNTSSCPVRGCLLSGAELEHLKDICSVWADSDDCGIHCPSDEKCRKKKARALRWYLRGVHKCSSRCSGGGGGDGKTRNICVFAEKLVLASGVSNHVRWLGVPGENSQFVTHDLSSFIRHVNSCDLGGLRDTPLSPPVVMVVGAGLTSADAILNALGKGLKVVHVFRQDPNDRKLIFNGIPKSEYPGYGRIFDLMLGKDSSDLYTCRPQSQVVEFGGGDRSVSVMNREGFHETWTDISIGGVFIGADANLDFLPENLIPKLGVDKEAPICSQNLINVDRVNFLSESVPCLYAIGSLTGECFVRFGIGSAVGAAQHLLGLN